MIYNVLQVGVCRVPHITPQHHQIHPHPTSSCQESISCACCRLTRTRTAAWIVQGSMEDLYCTTCSSIVASCSNSRPRRKIRNIINIYNYQNYQTQMFNATYCNILQLRKSQYHWRHSKLRPRRSQSSPASKRCPKKIQNSPAVFSNCHQMPVMRHDAMKMMKSHEIIVVSWSPFLCVSMQGESEDTNSTGHKGAALNVATAKDLIAVSSPWLPVWSPYITI